MNIKHKTDKTIFPLNTTLKVGERGLNLEEENDHATNINKRISNKIILLEIFKLLSIDDGTNPSTVIIEILL